MYNYAKIPKKKSFFFMKNDIFSFEFSTQIGKFFSPERKLHMMWTLYLYNCHVTWPVVDLRPNSRLSNTLYGIISSSINPYHILENI